MPSIRWFFAVLAAGSFAWLTAEQDARLEEKGIQYVARTDGAAMYRSYCASCHGIQGKGDGPAAAALKTPTPDLTKLAQHNQGSFPILALLQTLRTGSGAHGTAGMPVWGTIFRQSWGEVDETARIYNMLRYLESIQDPAPVPAVPVKESRPRVYRTTDVNPRFGGAMYSAYCASCHGSDGKGQGPAAAHLKGVPTDLTALRGTGKFPAVRIEKLLMDPGVAAHGSAEMPVWGEVFRSTHETESVVKLRVYNLTRYLESIQR